ncbi:MAG: T9SS type A sorting domain-containing protein [Candidatus Syntrophosphaera sp.]|jgi:hypothetical protein|nr:T9SS type A sorting domain-containing protein [Candidatus Cloacimonadota bacterium]MDX9949945.1 T9SS type A sorting domain-containing protein [Candidatus Syntrophosphaera sp.]
MKGTESLGTPPWMKTVDGKDIADLYGTYYMAHQPNGAWEPYELVIDENTGWFEVGDGNYYLHTFFELIYTVGTYVLSINSTGYAGGHGTLLKDGVEIKYYPWTWPVGEENLEWLYGTYSMAPEEGGTWSNPLVIDEDTSWEDVGYYQKNHTFVWTTDSHTPVELSSFSATIAGEFVNISWTSQTETQMMGYRVYRNTTSDQNGAMLIDHPMVPATNTSETHSYNVVDNEMKDDGTYYYWLEAVEYNTSSYHGPVSVNVSQNVPPVLPEVTSMKNAYPNPFKAGNNTNIEVSLKAGETGSFTIYNVMGQVVRTVSLNEGNHTINWNGRDSRGTAVGSGIYFYKLSTPSFQQTRKLVIVK